LKDLSLFTLIVSVHTCATGFILLIVHLGNRKQLFSVDSLFLTLSVCAYVLRSRVVNHNHQYSIYPMIKCVQLGYNLVANSLFRQLELSPIGVYQVVNRQLAIFLTNFANWRKKEYEIFYLLANIIPVVRQFGEFPHEFRQR